MGMVESQTQAQIDSLAAARRNTHVYWKSQQRLNRIRSILSEKDHVVLPSDRISKLLNLTQSFDHVAKSTPNFHQMRQKI